MNLKQEKFQFLGIYGIFRETIKLIYTGRRIFSLITLAFILPLSFSIFANSELSNLFVPISQKLPDFFSFEWIDALTFKIACFFFSIIFFFLSTSAAVYAAACVYTDRDVSINQLIRVAPKVCKRHLVTFLCLVVDFFVFNFVALSALVLISVVVLLLLNYEPYEPLTQLMILFVSAEALYFAQIWQMSSVVSVLEADSYGFEAIARSKELLQGKMAMAVILLVLIGFPFGAVQLVFRRLVAPPASSLGGGSRGVLGIIWILSFLLFFLTEIVMGTVVYFVCKSYHRESIEKSALSAHLQGYLPVDDCNSLKVEDDEKLDQKFPVV